MTTLDNPSTEQRIHDLTTDIERVLHANSNTLTMVKLALNPTLALLAYELGISGDAEKVEMTADQENALLDESAGRLIAALRQVQEASTEEQRLQALPQLRWDFLARVSQDLADYRVLAPLEESRASFLRNLAGDVLHTCDEIKPGALPRELVRNVSRSALALQKATLFIALSRARLAVVQIDHPFHALRDFITTGVRPQEGFTLHAVREVVERSIATLSEFAASRGVEVNLRDYAPGVQAPMLEREVQRAFTNLLHNAIKYSWSRSAGRAPWVTIEIRADARSVSVSFENRGVPIAKDEIDTGLIFELGYRGRLSKDRNRLGTGVGLADVLNTVRQHHGEIQVTSHPAVRTAENEPVDYNQPFITRFTVILPKNPETYASKPT